MNRKITRYLALIAIGLCLCEQAQATLIFQRGGYTGRGSDPLAPEMNPPHPGILNLSGSGTLGPPTFLAALGNPTPNSNLPFPVSGAVDNSLFSVTPSGTSVIVSWDLTGTDYTLGFALLETDFLSGGKPVHTLANRLVYGSNQPLEKQGTQYLYNGRIFGPVSHVSFYGVKGQFHLPETADTLWLLVIGTISVFLFRRWALKPL
jgi:hypothetical protein